jgi:nickel transport protein
MKIEMMLKAKHMRWYYLLPLLLLPALARVAPVAAHGSNISYTTGPAVALVAQFDNGAPMAGAQVTIYAPDDPVNSWMTGTCDAEGRFTFMPDPERPGNWEVQVRQSGHGDIVVIPIGAETDVATGMGEGVTRYAPAMQTAGGAGGYTPLQLLIMGASVVWGCVGTALFFINRK